MSSQLLTLSLLKLPICSAEGLILALLSFCSGNLTLINSLDAKFSITGNIKRIINVTIFIWDSEIFCSSPFTLCSTISFVTATFTPQSLNEQPYVIGSCLSSVCFCYFCLHPNQFMDKTFETSYIGFCYSIIMITNNCIKLNGRWVRGMSRGLHCVQPVPRQ